MQDERKEMLNLIYEHIVDEISISETMLTKAIKSYNAVGEWLGACDSDLNVKIFPQGSINLGTVIKPISDIDDYDIDLVCLLENGQDLLANEIKEIVGRRLKEHKTYNRMLDPEGRRCWTLRYDEFHMDILPSVPMNSVYIDPGKTGIRLTHKMSDNQYTDKYSNPAEYKSWFEEKMKPILFESKRAYATRNQVEIETVPTYAVKTPLQKAIQLLKRHRDIMFAEDKSGVAPISIIITTLAAKAYRNEENLYEALVGILERMSCYIEKGSNGQYLIMNPVMPAENFADKWTIVPQKAIAFFEWLDAARQDITLKPLLSEGMIECSNSLKKTFGENVVNRAYSKLGDEMRLAGDNEELYVTGLTGGLSTKNKIGNDPIPRHTFYGK